MDERVGKYYKLFSRFINGKRYFFVSRIGFDGFKWIAETVEKAVEIFEYAECYCPEEDGEKVSIS